jgi:hypothetical protein
MTARRQGVSCLLAPFLGPSYSPKRTSLYITFKTNHYLGLPENAGTPQVQRIEPVFHLNGKSLGANPHLWTTQICHPMGGACHWGAASRLGGGWDIPPQCDFQHGMIWFLRQVTSLEAKSSVLFDLSPAQVPEQTITDHLDVRPKHGCITQFSMW